jgi:hypothetical protein
MSTAEERERIRYSIHESLDPIIEEQARLREAVIRIEQKMAQWETGACLFRWFVMTTVGTIAMGAAAWDWLREHIR